MTVPICFASDNLTGQSFAEDELISISSQDNLTNSVDNNILSAGDVYFDASAASDGTGSQSSPYKTVTSSKLGSINHFAPGTYRVSSSLSSLFSFSSSAMTFKGDNPETTIIQYTGNDVFISTGSDLTLSGITLKGANIVSTGGLLTATNTIFDSGIAKVEEESDHTYYDNSYGGAIKQSISSTGIDWGSIFGGSSETGMKIDNCIFRNNFAAYGGAIYVEGGTTTITNTKFESNHAKNFGGSIAAINKAKLTVNDCEFNGDYSDYDAGGAIYVFNSTEANVKNTKFNDCFATFGSAITSLNSTMTISNSNFNRNKASWQGGAIYSMYGLLTVTASDFNNNSAKNGGAVFADGLEKFEVNGGSFKHNVANDAAGAIFAFANNVNKISTSYSSNEALKENDLYQADSIDLIIGSDNYQLIQYKSSYNGVLPSKFDLRSLNGVTPVKNQGQSGNCWAFATIAALESAILKASGKQYNLSEGNLKNLAQRFSDIGWDFETNWGGQYPFAFGYLTSWAGPVNASQDPTDDWDVLAPILNSVVHVQNIQYLQRTSYLDNNAIKEAIMKYGAVASEIFWSNSYLSGNNYYYPGDSGRNHAVAVVGWDDSRSISGAPGVGAWIIKNSYGSTRGDGGYYYVSYYDKSMFRLYDESYNSYAIIFNDTQRFNKNYQYDAAFTDYFLTGNDEMWYKNTFTSTGNDILTAFSTYFRRVTNWEAQIFVNDELKLTQSGKSNFGYYTINLNNPLPLKTGDTFTISLRIKCSSTADIPISESGAQYTLNKQYFKSGVSFFSTDGKTWTDFYNYKSTYGSGDSAHNYYNQVACIKAFTVEGANEILNSSIEFAYINSSEISVNVSNQNGEKINVGDVEFEVDGVKYVVSVLNSKSTLKLYLKPGIHYISAKYLPNQYYNSSEISQQISMPKETPNISIEASNITYGEELIVKVNLSNANGDEISIPVSVKINNIDYNASDRVNDLKPGSYTISVTSQSTTDFNSKSINKTINVSKVAPILSILVKDVKADEKISIRALLSNNITSRVYVNLNGVQHEVSVVNGEGEITVDGLNAGNYLIHAYFDENEYFNGVSINSSLNVLKINPEIFCFAQEIAEGDTAIINVYLPDDIEDDVTLQINSNSYTRSASKGHVIFDIDNLTEGLYDYMISFNGNIKYNHSYIQDSLHVLSKPKENLTISVTVKNNVVNVGLLSDARGNVTLKIASITLIKELNDGKASFILNNLSAGNYAFFVSFDGDEKYKSVNYHGNLVFTDMKLVNNTIIADDMARSYLSGCDYQATFTDKYGELLSNVDVLFIVNGNEYTVKTNQYGVAKLNIGFNVGEYKVTLINPVTGQNMVKTMKIVKRITENRNIQMDYNDGTLFKVLVWADNAKVVGAGERVIFKINGKSYSVKTDKKGYASLKLNLKPKTYSITTEYRGYNVSNKIVIKQILKAKNISKKKSKKIKFQAILKTSKGKAIKNKKITFKINGKKYVAKTNKRGVAAITLKNLKAGKYKIVSTYMKSSIKNTIKIRG